MVCTVGKCSVCVDMKHVFEQSAKGAVVCTSVEHGRQRAWEKTQQVAGMLSKQVQDKLQMAAAEESIRAREVGIQVGPSQQRCNSFVKPICKSQSVPIQHTVCTGGCIEGRVGEAGRRDKIRGAAAPDAHAATAN